MIEEIEWLSEMHQLWRSQTSHVFIITGNVEDYVIQTHRLPSVLSARFRRAACPAEDGETVTSNRIFVEYDMAYGLRFPNEQDQNAFCALLGGPQVLPGTPPGLAQAAGAPQAIALPKNPAGAFDVLDQVMRDPDRPAANTPSSILLLIRRAETKVPNTAYGQMGGEDRYVSEMLLNWASDPVIRNRDHIIVLTTKSLSSINQSLLEADSQTSTVHIVLPDRNARQAWIDWWTDEQKSREEEDRVGACFNLDNATIATMTSGLSRVHIEDVFYKAAARGVPITPNLIRDRKRDIISRQYGDVIAVKDPEFGYDMAPGNDQMKRLFTENIIPGLKIGDRKTNAGALMVGPPGTGKSWFAQCTAGEAGVNYMEVNLGRIRDKFVGESEAKLERILDIIRTLGGIVFIDEIDQALSRGEEGDSGVGKRIFGGFLDFMSDPELRGRVFFLGATNRPDLLDKALKRPGRFDKILPFVPPEEKDRAAVILSICQRQQVKLRKDTRSLLQNVARSPNGRDWFLSDKAKGSSQWCQSDLEALVIKAWEKSGKNTVGCADFCTAMDVLIPSSFDQRMLEAALREVNDRDLLPASYWQQADTALAESVPETHDRRIRN